MKRIIFLALILMAPAPSRAQTIKISLQDKLLKGGGFKQTRPTNQTDGFVGIDSVNFKTWGIEVFSFSSRQADNNISIKEGVTKERLLAYYKKYNIDTSYLTGNIIPENEIAALVTFDSKGRKYIKIDANNNKNFADDARYFLDTGKTYKEINLKIKTKYFDGLQIKTYWWPLSLSNARGFTSTILKDGKIEKSSEKYPFSFNLVNPGAKVGVASVDGQKYRFQLTNENNLLYKKASFDITIMIESTNKMTKDSDQIVESHYYKSTDSIPLGNRIYLIDNLADNMLSIKAVKLSPRGLAVKNSIAPEIVGKDLLTQENYSLKKLKGNYVLIDFWGTWCKPCVESLPDLVKFHKKYPNIKVLSIAYDRKEDIGKLLEMIKVNSLNWNHIFVDRNNQSSLIKDYQIQTYPTTLLIDPDGKILFRGVGKSILSQIDNSLKSVLHLQ